jgi:hypothetical protein
LGRGRAGLGKASKTFPALFCLGFDMDTAINNKMPLNASQTPRIGSDALGRNCRRAMEQLNNALKLEGYKLKAIQLERLGDD